jgi:hypothetical protein
MQRIHCQARGLKSVFRGSSFFHKIQRKEVQMAESFA